MALHADVVCMALQWHWHQQALLGVMSPWELHCVVLWALHGADGFVGCSGALQGFNVCLQLLRWALYAVMCVALQQCSFAALWCFALAGTRCSVVWKGCRRRGLDLG